MVHTTGPQFCVDNVPTFLFTTFFIPLILFPRKSSDKPNVQILLHQSVDLYVLFVSVPFYIVIVVLYCIVLFYHCLGV